MLSHSAFVFVGTMTLNPSGLALVTLRQASLKRVKDTDSSTGTSSDPMGVPLASVVADGFGALTTVAVVEVEVLFVFDFEPPIPKAANMALKNCDRLASVVIDGIKYI
jgi:hypothetical protein